MSDHYDELQSRVRGPVYPVVTPFKENGDIDFTALQNYTDYLVKGGAPVILLTVGTSRINLLNREEIRQVNKTVTETVDNRALTIVTGPGPSTGSTRENIKFAKHAEEIGADILLLVYPERWYGPGPLIDFYQDIADATEIGLMIHAIPMRDGFGGVNDSVCYSVDVMEHIAEIPAVVGTKEESGHQETYEEINNRLGNTFSIIHAGESMRRYLKEHDGGPDTYLVSVGSFKPVIEVEFYEAVVEGNLGKAEALTTRYEDPYYELTNKYGWHRSLKETLHLLGIMPPHERPPLNRLTESARQEFHELLDHWEFLEQTHKSPF